MAELANCKRCGSVFVKQIRDICDHCYKDEEDAFETVRHYLREKKNRMASMLQIVEDTGVDESYITKFIREKRLLVSQFPNLTYPCERCGNGITSGKLCENCQEELVSDLERHDELEKRKEALKKQEKEKINTYYTLNKHKR